MNKLINAEITRTTEKAYLIKVELVDGGYSELWFPQSAVEVEKLDNGGDGDIYAQEWIVENKQEEINDVILMQEGQF